MQATDVLDCRRSGRHGHHSYLGKKAAKRAAQSHTRAIRDGIVRCERCAGGMEPRVFRCGAAEQLWHWGHSNTVAARQQPPAVTTGPAVDSVEGEE